MDCLTKQLAAERRRFILSTAPSSAPINPRRNATVIAPARLSSTAISDDHGPNGAAFGVCERWTTRAAAFRYPRASGTRQRFHVGRRGRKHHCPNRQGRGPAGG